MAVLKQIPLELWDKQLSQEISDNLFTKILGIDWRQDIDSFH